jgi:predicted dehydrogenase
VNVLVIGCGSIGYRHASNASFLGHDVIAVDPSIARLDKLKANIRVKSIFTSLKDALFEEKCDAAVVAAPTALHYEISIDLIRAKIPLLVEKPLCCDLAQSGEIASALRENPVIFMMGHTYRFRRDWQEVKRLLDQAILGKIISAEFSGGWYLPDWHYREDYRKEYAAQMSQGGGVILTNMSHIFDIVAWLFGDIVKLAGIKAKVSELEIDVEDAVSVSMITASGCLVNVYEDFISRIPRRFLRVTCQHGFIEVDFNQKRMITWDQRRHRHLPDSINIQNPEDTIFILEDGIRYSYPESFTFSFSNVKDPYLEMIRHFFALVEQGVLIHDLDINSGLAVMRCLNGIANTPAW